MQFSGPYNELVFDVQDPESWHGYKVGPATVPDSACPVDMCCTCKHVLHMSKMIQIRHVPDRLHRKLKARAAAHGMPLSDYLRRELERVGEQLTPEELRQALARLEPVIPTESPADAIRAERDAR